MARHFSDRLTDQNFAESILKAIDEGYERILVVGTTQPFIDALLGYVVTEREPRKASRQLGIFYPNGQHVIFVSNHSKAMRGIQVDRVLVHPLASEKCRIACIPCEKPRPNKLPRVELVIDDDERTQGIHHQHQSS
jgi:hypothetical protein